MEKHAEASHRFLVCPPSQNIVLLALAFLVTGSIGCATVDLDIDDIIENDTGNAEDTDSEIDSNRTDSSESDSETQVPDETDSENSEDSEVAVDSETETDTARDTSSTDIHCPSYSHGWPCTCRKLILGCDDGSECIGLEGLFDQKTGYCAKSCTPETGLTDCQSPYGGLGDCRISDPSESKFYCAIYCETDFHCPPSQTCQRPPDGLFSVCHP